MKRFVTFVLVLVLLLSFAGCSNTAVLYQDEDVNVSLIDLESLPEITIGYDLLPLTEELAFEKTELIAEGTISNVREVAIAYNYMDADVVDYCTLMDFTFTDIIYQSDTVTEKAGNTVTVFASYNTYTLGEGFPTFEEGNTAIFFGTPSSNYADSPMKYAAYSDYLACTPNYLFLKEDANDHYRMNEVFSEFLAREDTLVKADVLKQILAQKAQAFHEKTK